ncbi:MAG: hypothetical protein A2603_03745 [Bdellovibrionales bacterium RIFOXYD1_FULL_55_31]|nr:MAG: hypothetical protein A2603_03745 [Bdellovibrionales bacterium RIFOXYD1_FULL_55_31]
MLVTSKSTDVYAKREAGGKGYNLYLLSREGFPVPKWLVLGARVFREFRKENDLDLRIASVLHGLGRKSAPEELKTAEKKIHDLITEMPLSGALEKLARNAYGDIASSPGTMIAVRSSAVDEDSARHSFAGQLSTFLFVKTEEQALRMLKECWASAFSERGLSYRIQNGIELENPIEVAVIFQEMLDSEKSGVLFTCDPIQNDGTKMTINAVFGVGEGLVSGLLDGDTFLIEKKTGKKLSEELAQKKSKLTRGDSLEGTREVPVPEALQNVPCLTDAELQELAAIGGRVEGFYRYPQDIEWGWRDGRFYLLQSRPVTTPVRNEEGFLYVWDNSNIVESYGGITLPLTFTFAHHVYHSVYVQFCEILLIPQREIRRMDYFLRNMLGIFYGRIYYNLLNWYKLTSILPGFKYNRSFMETMMGTSQSLSDEIADRIKPPGFQEKLSSKFRRFISGLKFLYFHFTIQNMVDDFLKYFHSIYDEYRRKNFSRMPADEIYAVFQELEAKLLFEWKAPIVNDYLTMVHFGILKKLTAKWLGSLGDSLQNDLLCGEGNLESAEPTRELIRMAADIQSNEGLRQLFDSTASENCYEALVQSSFTGFRNRVERYIDLYGFRCMNEMKLEERDLYQDPTFLFVCLKNYLRTGQTDLDAYEKREKEIRSGAEKKVMENLSGVKRRVYLWSLKHARKAVRNRENTRFCRTRIYGLVRAMFFGVGRDFTARSILDSPEDVFFIELSELSGALEGTLPVHNLRALAEVRKREYAGFQDVEPAPRFMTRGPAYWMNEHSPVEADTVTASEALPENCLKGIGCCPGLVEGTVKVVLSPKDDMELNREILVTLRTDPGWIPLYPSASALLVERGGLLSHSAIVAREMGLPTIVGVKGLVQKLKSGMRVRMNGETGMIEVLDGRTSAEGTPQ